MHPCYSNRKNKGQTKEVWYILYKHDLGVLSVFCLGLKFIKLGPNMTTQQYFF